MITKNIKNTLSTMTLTHDLIYFYILFLLEKLLYFQTDFQKQSIPNSFIKIFSGETNFINFKYFSDVKN